MQTTPLCARRAWANGKGLTRADIEARGDKQLLADYLRDSHTYRPPGSETLEAVWERISRAVQAIRRDHPAGRARLRAWRQLSRPALRSPGRARFLHAQAVAGQRFPEHHRETGPPDNRICRVTLINDTSTF